MVRSLPIVLVLSLLAATGAAKAQNGPVGFLTPSRNIVCQSYTSDGQNTLRCDIMEINTRPRRPADCDLEWGDAFEMTTKGTANPVCHGDTMMDQSLPVLAYGQTWQRGGFTCRSEETGVTCFNAARRGFFLSRSRQQLF